MPSGRGKIVLMGSGEMTATMVEVHKGLLSQLGRTPQAAFLDTPAGFQLNVDQISQKAVEYFRNHVQQPLAVASFKSRQHTSDFDAEKAFRTLRDSAYILIGPGSPTYAVNQWRGSPVAEIFTQCVNNGGCLVAASAAALTVGRFTLPVYEIYRVGQKLHWVEGIDILGKFGFNLVVIPHWNNAEGGTHDTRFCFMGQPRFQKLVTLMSGIRRESDELRKEGDTLKSAQTRLASLMRAKRASLGDRRVELAEVERTVKVIGSNVKSLGPDQKARSGHCP